MKEDRNEPSNPDFAAAITRFVKNYGRDVQADKLNLFPDMGASEELARSIERSTGVDSKLSY